MTEPELDQKIKELSPLARICFVEHLYHLADETMLDYSGCYYPGESPEICWDTVVQIYFAPFDKKLKAYEIAINQTA